MSIVPHSSFVKLIIASFLVAVVCVGIAMMTAGLDRDLPDQGQQKDCDYQPPTAQSPSAAGRNAKPATAAVSPPAGTINFGGARAWQFLDVTVTAGSGLDPTLPSRVLLSAPRRFYRENANLATVAAGRPKFTAPTMSSDRRLEFTVCLNGSNLPPGRYTGTVSISDPKGSFQATEMAFTVNARNSKLFAWSLGISLFVSYALLALKGAVDAKTQTVRDAAMTTKAMDVADTRGLEDAFLTDPKWWLVTVAALGLGAVAAYGIYQQNAAWGDDPVAAIIAVGGAVFTPAGVRSVFSGS